LVSALQFCPSCVKGCLLAIAVLLLLLLTGCGSKEEYLAFRGETMGTQYTITFKEHPDCAVKKNEIDALLRTINDKMSTYQPGSELSLINRQQSPGEFPISSELSFLLHAAKSVSDQTNGAFDITIGPLVNLWGFGPSEVLSGPSILEQNQVKSQIGMANLVVNSYSLVKKQAGMYVDLSAIAKGYAVDRLSVFMEGRGCYDHLVDIGGEAKLRGNNPFSEPWRIGIEKPHGGADRIQQVLHLSDIGIATSGNYRNFRESDLGRVSHVMDPRNGMPSKSRVASATVLHDSTMMADAYATSLMVLGYEEGMRLAQKQELAVYMILEESGGRFEERYNEQMKRYIGSDGD